MRIGGGILMIINSGFVLYYKRLERGTFSVAQYKIGELSWSDLVLMVEGIQVVKSIQKKRYSLL